MNGRRRLRRGDALPTATIDDVIAMAAAFSTMVTKEDHPDLYGVTDGKAIGTYIERGFKQLLLESFDIGISSAAKGIDFPELGVDVKCTKYTQPQSSCPFKSARQKVYGLGYNLLVFVYDKTDDNSTRIASLDIQNCIFVDRSRTADFTLTKNLHELIDNGCNAEDIASLLQERKLPLTEKESLLLANDIIESPPSQGYLTISNALQWRLQYARAIKHAGHVDGVIDCR